MSRVNQSSNILNSLCKQCRQKNTSRNSCDSSNRLDSSCVFLCCVFLLFKRRITMKTQDGKKVGH